MSSTYVSPQIEDILGVTPQAYLDDPDLWSSMLHPDDRARAIETYTTGRETGEPFTMEYRSDRARRAGGLVPRQRARVERRRRPTVPDPG